MNDEDITINAIDWIEDHENKRFFLWMHYMHDHFLFGEPDVIAYDSN